MQLFVKTLDGTTITVNVENSDSISHIKDKIQTKQGVPKENQRLIFNGKELQDDKTIADYDLKNDIRQLGLPPTGHAARGGGGAPGIAASNTHIAPGTVSPAGLIADIADGVYVTELIGHGVNGVTGDYSRGASGYRIVQGEIAGPVAEFTIAGNLIDMFRALTPADDLEWQHAINVPTLRVDGMMIAGD